MAIFKDKDKDKDKVKTKVKGKNPGKDTPEQEEGKLKSIGLELKKMLEDSLKPVEGAAELAEKVRNELALSGTTNEMTQKQSLGTDMVNSLDNGIPGYQVTGEDHAIDEVANNIEMQQSPFKK
ncbi:Uncharacterised protein [Legionella beliardensis]|uniref:Uncharacterized protein n=1 Tax=Legionella beliardensis TaxID=91822 RepID=A0A378I553_9GAMM|nr:hypothetical protein [Legionella beliardensis]STX29972.1 Uncharacterised protein [Legionella beliardensis]